MNLYKKISLYYIAFSKFVSKIISHTSSTDDGKFGEAIAVLFSWIERGEVNRRTANHFYAMIQSANSHVRRLMNEKAQHEEEMEQAKEHFKNSLLTILNQCKIHRPYTHCLRKHVHVVLPWQQYILCSAQDYVWSLSWLSRWLDQWAFWLSFWDEPLLMALLSSSNDKYVDKYKLLYVI